MRLPRCPYFSFSLIATGRPLQTFPLSDAQALLLQLIFQSLLLLFSWLQLLKYQKLCDFACGFHTVPDASKFTRFKCEFLSDLLSLFGQVCWPDWTDMPTHWWQSIHGSIYTSVFTAFKMKTIPNDKSAPSYSFLRFKKAKKLMIPYDFIKSVYTSIRPMPPPTMLSSRCTSTGISATLTKVRHHKLPGSI